MKLRQKLASFSAICSAMFMSLMFSAPTHAALATEVTDAITAATADIVQAGGLLIALAAVMLGLRWTRGAFFGG